MSEVNKVEVVIGGEIITLKSAESEEYIHKLARYVDRKINQMKAVNSNASINEKTKTIFIAVNVADDYFKTMDKFTKLKEEHEKYIVALGEEQEENILLHEKILDLQYQLNKSREELEDFMKSFDDAVADSKVLEFSKGIV
jgi:cell division protein ZapA